METTIKASKNHINTVDAIWNLIQCQSASVRNALTKRMIEANEKQKTSRQQKMVKETLHRAMDEVREAKRSGKPMMSFDDFLKEVNS